MVDRRLVGVERRLVGMDWRNAGEDKLVVEDILVVSKKIFRGVLEEFYGFHLIIKCMEGQNIINCTDETAFLWLD